MCCLFIFVLSAPLLETLSNTQGIVSSAQTTSNTASQVRQWREALTQAMHDNDIKTVDSLTTKGGFAIDDGIKPCHSVFVDLGANVGDSLRKFIEAGFPPLEGRQPKLDFKTGRIGDTFYGVQPKNKKKKKKKLPREDRFTLPQLVQERLDENEHPEDFCYYGVEGNPRFTSRLLEVESNVMRMKPRPVQLVRFLTQHVATDTNGPTKIYLDTVNVEHNFWGSSIYSTHHNAVKSNKTAVDVQGITLSTLLKKAVRPPGHVIVKIDIEGAEFMVLSEVVKSNILCELVQNGVKVHVIVEYHDDKKLGTDSPRLGWEKLKGEAKLRACGVHYTVENPG